jgi:Raf kinase inhibitor-like YbhB/YbcL family protein
MLCVLAAAGLVSLAAGPPMTLRSPAFGDGQDMQLAFTCDGNDQSPPLEWTGVPKGTRSLALLRNDPDAPAGTCIQWVIYDMPPSTDHLRQGLARVAEFAEGAKQGRNSWRDLGYKGPCPLPGTQRRCLFTLYASDVLLGLKPGASGEEVLAALKGHVPAKARLAGVFLRAHR